MQEFLEVDLLQEHTVTGVLTQGRFANGQGQEYAEHFQLQYWREGMEAFALYQNKQGLKIFPGNKDTFTAVDTVLDPPIRASRVRVIPFSYHPRTVCMRVELRGCLTSITGMYKTSYKTQNLIFFKNILKITLLTYSAQCRMISKPSEAILQVADNIFWQNCHSQEL